MIAVFSCGDLSAFSARSRINPGKLSEAKPVSPMRMNPMRMKKSTPDQYAIVSKCAFESNDMKELMTCMMKAYTLDAGVGSGGSKPF